MNECKPLAEEQIVFKQGWRHTALGRAVQIDLIKPALKAPGT